MRRRGFGDIMAGTCGTGPGQIDCSKNQPTPYQLANGITGFDVGGNPLWSSPAAQHAFTCASPAGMYDPSCAQGAAAPAAPAPTMTAIARVPSTVTPAGPRVTPVLQFPDVCPAWGCGNPAIVPVPTPGPTSTQPVGGAAPAAGFSFGSLPWWVWAGGAAALYFVFAGGGHGR